MKSSLETKGIIWTSLSWSLIGRCAKLPTANKMILALPFEKILHRWKMPVAHWPAKDITATKQKSLCFRGHSCTSSPYDRSHYICLLLWFTVHGLIGQRDNQGVTCCRRWGGKIVGGMIIFGSSLTGICHFFENWETWVEGERETVSLVTFHDWFLTAKRPLQSLAITGGNLS